MRPNDVALEQALTPGIQSKMCAPALQPGALQGEEFDDTPDHARRYGHCAKKGGFVQHAIRA